MGWGAEKVGKEQSKEKPFSPISMYAYYIGLFRRFLSSP